MAKSLNAINLGIDYQCLWFWKHVCKLFEPETNVKTVAYEIDDPKAFDDVAVYYNAENHIDDNGMPLYGDFYQVKFHIDGSGYISWENLIDPDYIGASKNSIIMRLRDAQQKYAPQGSGYRFILYTTDGIMPTTPLAELYSRRNNSIDVDKLFIGGPKSEMGVVRAMLREHLGLDTDDALRPLLMPFRIVTGMSFEELKQDLNLRLALVGLLPVPDSIDTNPYISLARTLAQQNKGVISFGKADAEFVCKRNRLWSGYKPYHSTTKAIGIRSFTRGTDNMTDKAEDLLDLCHCFSDRYIVANKSWKHDIASQIDQFITANISTHQEMLIYLDAHSSIAFTVGYCLDTKSGIKAIPIQKTNSGTLVWDTVSGLDDNYYPDWAFDSIPKGPDCEGDVALVISVTHDIIEDVKIYIDNYEPNVGRIICCSLPGGTSNSAILDGSHARKLTQSIARMLKTSRTPDERLNKLHIFSAAPNALIFFLGQLARSFGEIILYEYDFTRNAPGAYEPSIRFPL